MRGDRTLVLLLSFCMVCFRSFINEKNLFVFDIVLRGNVVWHACK